MADQPRATAPEVTTTTSVPEDLRAAISSQSEVKTATFAAPSRVVTDDEPTLMTTVLM